MENINNCRELLKRICLSRTNRHVEQGERWARKRSNTRNIQTEYLPCTADRGVPALNYAENPEILENNSLSRPKESFGIARRAVSHVYDINESHDSIFCTRRACSICVSRKPINTVQCPFSPLFLLINHIRARFAREARRRKGPVFVTSDVGIDESRPQWSRRYRPRLPRSAVYRTFNG